MQGLVHKAGVADTVRELIVDAYHAVGSDAVVVVRSSATGEDGRDASFAGMNATITNVSGDDGLIDAVLRCRMSPFSPRVITYRASRDFTADPEMAEVVQQMVDSEKAGVAFTVDPSNGAQDRVVIEGTFGLGEVVLSGPRWRPCELASTSDRHSSNNTVLILLAGTAVVSSFLGPFGRSLCRRTSAAPPSRKAHGPPARSISTSPAKHHRGWFITRESKTC
jgi:hypothetical protein